ncbi:PTS suar transporter subunit IIA [Salmonella enterica subsp. enterica]|uniref:PTS suar transporter subunit IIA n=1 Tax=Salmonella enterica I TaxID=59201 RepID=A0A379W1Q9_SALET|nr:PTS suar transporter subunit IIA [Salmonella enterica subsp. enterica]
MPLALEYWQNPSISKIWAGTRSRTCQGGVMLALGESNKQLNVLGWIMDVIQDEDFMQQLLVMNDDEIYQSITHAYLKEVKYE